MYKTNLAYRTTDSTLPCPQVWHMAIETLVGGLEHFFHSVGNNTPIWLSYFSEGWLNYQQKYFLYQWPFQDPKLEVPTIYKAYCSGLNFREYPPQNMAWKMVLTSEKYGTFTYLHVLDHGDLPLNILVGGIPTPVIYMPTGNSQVAPDDSPWFTAAAQLLITAGPGQRSVP